MCTSLLYSDQTGSFYAGRTLELAMELPYLVSYLPKGTQFGSETDQSHVLTFESKYDIFGVTVPNGSVKDLKIVEGINEAGLNFSLLAYSGAEGPLSKLGDKEAPLSAIDLGAWALSLFSTVAEVKAALETETVLVMPFAALGGAKPPFHYTIHDRSGASIVIEFSDGERRVYDNPLGVMTNGPRFDWHLTNLNNYTFLSNIDQTSTQFGQVSLTQPDSGIATAGLPASDTSVGRFIRAVYYSQFAEKAANAEEAIQILGHVMNKFDRPKGASKYKSEHASVLSASAAKLSNSPNAEKPEYISEYTSWTTLIDLNQNKFYLRTYDSLNYVCFDLNAMASGKAPQNAPLKAVKAETGDATAKFLSLKMS